MKPLLALALLVIIFFSPNTGPLTVRAQAPVTGYYLGEDQGIDDTIVAGPPGSGVSGYASAIYPVTVEFDDPVVGAIQYATLTNGNNAAVLGLQEWIGGTGTIAPSAISVSGAACRAGTWSPDGIVVHTGADICPVIESLYGVSFSSYIFSFGTNVVPAPAGNAGEQISLFSEAKGENLALRTYGVRLIYYGEVPLIANFTADPAEGYAPLTVQFTDTSPDPEEISEWYWDFGDGYTSIEQNPIHTFPDKGDYVVTLTITDFDDRTGSHSETITVNNLGELVKPLSLEDRDVNFGEGETTGFRDYSDLYKSSLDNEITDFIFYNAIQVGPHSVQAISNYWGAKVMAVEAGTITSATRLNPDNCANGTVFQGVSQFTPRDTCAVKLFQNSELDDGSGPDELFVQYAWIVTIQDIESEENIEYTYLVANADRYVQSGDIVDAGCIIGETIPFKETIDEVKRQAPSLDFSIGFVGISDVLALFNITYPDVGLRGVAIVAAYQADKNLELLSALVQERNPNEACNHNELLRTCKNADPGLEHADQWTPVNQVDWLPTGGVVLGPGASITSATPMNLDPAQQYSFSVLVLPETAYFAQIGSLQGPHMQLRLGQTSEDFDLGTVESFGGEPHRVGIEQAIHEPDLGSSGLYTIAIENTGSSNLRLMSACVAENADGISPVGSCYFQDPRFQNGGVGFTIPGGVEVGQGAVYLNDGETISATVTLYAPDGEELSGTYTLVAEFGLWYTGNVSERTGNVWMSYEFPASAGFNDFEIEGASEGPFGWAVGAASFGLNPKQVIVGIITVSSDTTSTITVRADVDSSDPNVYGVALTKLCLTGDWPGRSIDDYFPGLVTTTCTSNPMPTDQSNIGLWLTWHWNNLNNFFQCDLMRLLNLMYRNGLDIFHLFGYSVRYALAEQDITSRWLNDQLFPYLNGHFRNIAIGTVTNITDGSANLFDVLLALINSVLSPLTNLIVGVLSQAASLLFNIITALLTLLLSAFGQLMQLFGMGRGLIEALALAWNSSTPTAIPYLPNCADPQSNGFCILMWALENTVFSPLGPGALIIPVLIGIFSVHLLIWGVEEFRKLMLAVGSST